MIDGRRATARAQRAGERSQPSPTIKAALGSWLVRRGVRADLVTGFGVLLAIGTGVVIGVGDLWTGVVLLTVGGLMDTLDGIVAKAAGTVSARGAFLDSVADRVSDSFILGGVAWFLATHHDPRTAIVPVAILGVSGVISYERAKAESLGFTARGGMMERAERLILVGLALLFNVVMLPILGVLLALSTVTATGRFVRVWRQASGVAAHEPRVLRSVAESRWRTWRATASVDKSRRSRRDIEPLATRLRGAIGTSGVGVGRRRQRPGQVRSARAIRRRFDAGN